MVRFSFPCLEVGGIVEGPADQVWKTLTDTRLWPLWGPSVAAVDCPSIYIREGTRGTVHTVWGLRLPFEVTDYVEGTSWSWKVRGVRATGHRVFPLDGKRSLVWFLVPWWAFPYGFVCLLAVRRLAALHRVSRDPGDEVRPAPSRDNPGLTRGKFLRRSPVSME